MLNLRLMAAGFLIVGLLFIITPDGVLNAISDFGDHFGDFPRAPETEEKFWLALAFAYMMTITAIAVVAQTDVIRYRALIGILVVAKTTSSLAALGFFVFDQDVFIYLLNFLVDGFLAISALWLYSLVGKIGRPPEPG